MDLMTLAAKVTLDTSEYEKGVSKTEKAGKQLSEKLTAKTIAVGNLMSDFTKSAIRKVGQVATDVIKSAVKSFAEYEQLVGGVETLFGDTSKQVFKFADEAYKTVGVSANQYMETVTSFAASLLQSLGGDTDKAADYADMAMRDMADNANKMGSSMESIENAYKGFSKQNYTMLDNLKLGYGGTRKEMERLLKDAGKLTGRKFNIKNLSDVYEAIHIIQQELGIYGTTEKEAESTISGSINSMKASWTDLLTAMGSGKGVKKAVKKFSDSFKVVLQNVTPVISQIASSIPGIIADLMPSIGDIINEIGRGIFGKQWDITINWIQNAWTDVQNAIGTVSAYAKFAHNLVVEWVQKTYDNISNAIAYVDAKAKEGFQAALTWIIHAWSDITNTIDQVKAWGHEQFQAMLTWIVGAWDDITKTIEQVNQWGVKAFEATLQWVMVAWQDITDFIKKLPEQIDIVVNFIKKVTDSVDAAGGVGNIVEGQVSGDISPVLGFLSNWFGNAKGNWTVPYDNYPALLHRNEMVLTKSQARQLRDGSGMNYDGVGEMIGASIEKAMGRVYVMLNGDKVGDLTSRRVKRNINASTYTKLRAMGG